MVHSRNKSGPTPNGFINRLVLLTMILLSGRYCTYETRIYRFCTVCSNLFYVQPSVVVRTRCGNQSLVSMAADI